ncbi:hypothetical protein ACFX1R_048261 [Malus domestica]
MVVVGGLPCWYCCSVSKVLGGLQSELEECMRDLVLWVLCWVKLGLRIRWDCGLVIRSRGSGIRAFWLTFSSFRDFEFRV